MQKQVLSLRVFSATGEEIKDVEILKYTLKHDFKLDCCRKEDQSIAVTIMDTVSNNFNILWYL